ncbi:MAG: hypothetical protein ACEQSA_01015 [Weeksellaceae bacterium]
MKRKLTVAAVSAAVGYFLAKAVAYINWFCRSDLEVANHLEGQLALLDANSISPSRKKKIAKDILKHLPTKVEFFYYGIDKVIRNQGGDVTWMVTDVIAYIAELRGEGDNNET